VFKKQIANPTFNVSTTLQTGLCKTPEQSTQKVCCKMSSSKPNNLRKNLSLGQ